MKLSRREIRKLIEESVKEPSYSHYGVGSFIAPKSHVDTSSPGDHASMAIIHLENIVKEISQVPEKNLKRYLDYA